MKPYIPYHKGYRIVATDMHYPVSIRPTKNAAGLSYSRASSGKEIHHISAALPDNDKHLDISRLAVYGTLDPLARYNFGTERKACACCGSKNMGKVVLSDRGRARLATLRAKRTECL